jgi:hypothetical protein
LIPLLVIRKGQTRSLRGLTIRSLTTIDHRDLRLRQWMSPLEHISDLTGFLHTYCPTPSTYFISLFYNYHQNRDAMVGPPQTSPRMNEATERSSSKYWNDHAPPAQRDNQSGPGAMKLDTLLNAERSFPKPIARTSAYPTDATSHQPDQETATLSNWRVPELYQNNPKFQGPFLYARYRGPSVSPPPTSRAPTGEYVSVQGSDPGRSAQPSHINLQNTSRPNAPLTGPQNRSQQLIPTLNAGSMEGFTDTSSSASQPGARCTESGAMIKQLPGDSRELPRSTSVVSRPQGFSIHDPGTWGPNLEYYNSYMQTKVGGGESSFDHPPS